MKRSAVVHNLNRLIDLIPMFQETIRGISYTNCGAMGRKPLKDITKFMWDESRPHVYVYWKDEEKRYIDITAEEPGYEVFAGDDMNNYFHTQNLPIFLEYLDVSHLDVSEVRDFRFCFSGNTSVYKQCFPTKLEGYENWDTSKAEQIDGMFKKFLKKTQNSELDLSKWNFDNVKSACETFQNFEYNAENVKLILPVWNMRDAINCTNMFNLFAQNAENVSIKGLDKWRINTNGIYNYMFKACATKSNLSLDLTKWGSDTPLLENSIGFADETFFKIKKPNWSHD